MILLVSQPAPEILEHTCQMAGHHGNIFVVIRARSKCPQAACGANGSVKIEGPYLWVSWFAAFCLLSFFSVRWVGPLWQRCMPVIGFSEITSASAKNRGTRKIWLQCHVVYTDAHSSSESSEELGAMDVGKIVFCLCSAWRSCVEWDEDGFRWGFGCVSRGVGLCCGHDGLFRTWAEKRMGFVGLVFRVRWCLASVSRSDFDIEFRCWRSVYFSRKRHGMSLAITLILAPGNKVHMLLRPLCWSDSQTLGGILCSVSHCWRSFVCFNLVLLQFFCALVLVPTVEVPRWYWLSRQP